MPKKITVYPAFGQFIDMVQRQAELEKELNADCYRADHSLGECQDSLNSARPVSTSGLSGLLVSFNPMSITVSPGSTRDERGIAIQVSFNNIVASQKSETDNEAALPSISEKDERLFSKSSTTSVTSLFGNFENIFEEMVVKTPTKEELLWTYPDQPPFPQLPFFVKSPVDSLKIYKSSHEKTAESVVYDKTWASAEASDTSSSSSNPIASPSSSSTTIVAGPNHLLLTVRLQQAIMDEQKKIIDSLYSLLTLNQKSAFL